MCTSPQKSLNVEKIRKSANFFMNGDITTLR